MLRKIFISITSNPFYKSRQKRTRIQAHTQPHTRTEKETENTIIIITQEKHNNTLGNNTLYILIIMGIYFFLRSFSKLMMNER